MCVLFAASKKQQAGHAKTRVSYENNLATYLYIPPNIRRRMLVSHHDANEMQTLNCEERQAYSHYYYCKSDYPTGWPFIEGIYMYRMLTKKKKSRSRKTIHAAIVAGRLPWICTVHPHSSLYWSSSSPRCRASRTSWRTSSADARAAP